MDTTTLLNRILQNQKTIMEYMLFENQTKRDDLIHQSQEHKGTKSIVASTIDCEIAKRGDLRVDLEQNINATIRCIK